MKGVAQPPHALSRGVSAHLAGHVIGFCAVVMRACIASVGRIVFFSVFDEKLKGEDEFCV